MTLSQARKRAHKFACLERDKYFVKAIDSACSRELKIDRKNELDVIKIQTQCQMFWDKNELRNVVEAYLNKAIECSA